MFWKTPKWGLFSWTSEITKERVSKKLVPTLFQNFAVSETVDTQAFERPAMSPHLPQSPETDGQFLENTAIVRRALVSKGA